MKTFKTLKEKTLFLLDALNNEDFVNAKECLHEEFTYKDPLIQTIDKDDFLYVMKERNLKYQLLRSFAQDHEVCLVYNLLDGMKTNLPACGLYEFKDDKILSLEIVFDPRPLLDLPL